MNRIAKACVATTTIVGVVGGRVRLKLNDDMAIRNSHNVDKALVGYMWLVEPGFDMYLPEPVIWRDNELKRIETWKEQRALYQTIFPPPTPDYLAIFD